MWRTPIDKRIKLVFSILLLFLSSGSYAQTFTGNVSKNKVAVGERFRLTYRLENVSGNSFQLGSIPDFSVVGGPYQSNQTSIVNGNMSQSLQISYDLVPNKKGKFTIPAAVFKTTKGSIKSNSIDVEVGEGNMGNQNSGGQSSGGAGGNQQTQGSDVFLVASANRNSVYEGEQIALTIKLYSQFSSVSLEEIHFPELKGGWVQDVQDAVDSRFQIETYNGKRFNAATLRKSILIPTASGELNFDPVKSTMVVQRTVRSNDPFENFFGGRVEEQRINVTSTRIKFNVLPLPTENRPQSFVNAVGKFEMKASLDRSELDANDAVNLKVIISGNGNLVLLQPPVIKFPPSFEVPEPIVNDKYKITAGGITGSKEFEYLIIPRSGGEFTIGPIRFSYFDPATKKYHEVSSDSLKLKVNGAVIENVSTGGSEVELLDKDIRYIKDKETFLGPLKSFFFRSTLYYILVVLPFVLSLLVVIFRRALFRRVPDLEQKRIRQADSVAIKRLQVAKKLLQENNRDKYYEELNRAFIGFLSDKYSIAFADMNRANIRATLTAKGVDEGLTGRAISILDACEFARFAPSSDSQQESLYQQALDLITEMDKRS